MREDGRDKGSKEDGKERRRKGERIKQTGGRKVRKTEGREREEERK